MRSKLDVCVTREITEEQGGAMLGCMQGCCAERSKCCLRWGSASNLYHRQRRGQRPGMCAFLAANSWQCVINRSLL